MEIPPQKQGSTWEKWTHEPIPVSLRRGEGGPASATVQLQLCGRHRELFCLWDGM